MSVKSNTVPFNWQDPFMLEQQLSEEERLVRDSTKKIRTGEIAASRPGCVSERRN